MVETKSNAETTVRLLLVDHEEETLSVSTDGFQVYDPLEDDDTYQPGVVVLSAG